MEWISSHSSSIYIIGIFTIYIIFLFLERIFIREKNPDFLMYVFLSLIWPVFLFVGSVVGIFYIIYLIMYKIYDIFGID